MKYSHFSNKASITWNYRNINFLANKSLQYLLNYVNLLFINFLESPSAMATNSRKEYLYGCQLILFKFIGALVDQIYDIFMIISLILINQYILALLFFLTDFVPGLFTVWQKYLSENKIWRKSYVLLLCHPINMIVWPLIVVFYPSDENKNQLEVYFNFKQIVLTKFYFIYTRNTHHTL